MAGEFNPFAEGATAVEEPPISPAGGFDPFKDGGAKAAPASPRAMFTPHTAISKDDPDAQWRSLYAGLEGLDQRLDSPQKQAFTALDHLSKDPQEERARAINQTFVGEKLKMAPAAVASNWDAVKSAFAKDQLGIDQGKITDKAFYGWIGGRLGNGPQQNLDPEVTGEIKAWTWQDTLKADYYATKRNLGAFWDKINLTPLDKLPDAPPDLPDVIIPGGPFIVSPAVAGALWNGWIKPTLASVISPVGIATLGVGTELSVASKTLPAAKIALRGMTGAFTAWMGWGAAQAAPEAWRVQNDPKSSTQERITAWGPVVTNGLMASLGALDTAFSFLPEKAPKIAEQFAGKKPSEAAEILRQEAVTASPDAADAFNRAATHFEELGAYERGPDAWAAAAHPQERIVAAAIKTEDGAVAEGPAHEAIREELGATETPIGSQEGFVTSSGRFVDRIEAHAIAEDAKQVVEPAAAEGEAPKSAPPELQAHAVDMGPPRSAFSQTALKNAYGELERVAYGFDEAPATEKRAMAEVWERAASVMEKDPKAGERLAAQLKANPNLGLSDDQSALLLRHKAGLEKALNAAADASWDPNTPPQEKAVAQAQVKELSDQLLDILNANYARGTEWGREGRWRQALAQEDFSLATQETLLRSAKGDAQLTDAERAGLQKRIDDLQKKQAELEAHIARQTSVSHTQAADRAVKAMADSPRAARPMRVAEGIRVKLHARAEESMKYLFSGKQFTIGPDVLYHMSVIGADTIYSTGLDFAQWSAAMVTKIGEKVKPHLADAWEASKKLFHTENRAGLISELQSKSPEERQKSLSRIAQELARVQIEQGVKEREAIVDAVHADIAKGIPDISKREVMDAISGYGQFKPLTHDQITDQLRDIKGQLQQVAKLEDMAAGQSPKKTGMERKTMSDEERRLVQQVEAAKKEGGYDVTDPETQLRTAIQAVKTRLTNQIADLEKQIESRTKIVRENKGVVYDDEANQLKARRDELKEQFDGVFGRKELTEGQRLNIWKAYANRRIGELNERLAAKDFEPKAQRPPPRLDAEGNRIKGELERIKQDFAIERAKAEDAAQPKWQKAMREVSGLARASALSGYHTLIKLASFSLGRFAETPVTEATGAIIRQIPGLKSIGKLANLEAGAEYKGLARYYSQAATQGMVDAWETLKLGKSNIKAELGDRKFNVTPIRWYDYFGLSHMVEKSPLLRGEFELRLEKNFQSALANGLDVSDPLVNGALRKEAFDYSQRAILQENNMFSDWINSLTARLEATNPNVGKPDVIKMALSTFVKTFLTKGIVKTPANYIMQTLERTPLGLAKGTAQAVVAHIQGIDKLTPQEANVIHRLLKVGAVGSAMFVWGAIDATKDPKDRMLGGYYQSGEKRGDQDVGWGKIRVAGHEFPHLVTHNPLTESAQMGATFVRVMRSRLTKKDTKDKGPLAGGMAAILGLASQSPVVNPITQMAEKVARGNADEVFWDEIAGLVPQLSQNLAADIDGKSRKAESFKQRMELTVPVLREQVPETKAQKRRDIKERLKK